MRMVVDGPYRADRRQEAGVRLLGAGVAESEEGNQRDGESGHGDVEG